MTNGLDEKNGTATAFDLLLSISGGEETDTSSGDFYLLLLGKNFSFSLSSSIFTSDDDLMNPKGWWESWEGGIYVAFARK